MPQIRKAAAKDLQFSVSPWHVKQPAGELDVKQTHQETYFAVQPDQPAQPAAAADIQSKAKRPVQQHANESKWQTRKKPALSDGALQAIIPDNTPSSQEQSSDTGEDEERPGQTGTSGAVLQGTAVLAFLPSGQLSGRPCLPTCSPTCALHFNLDNNMRTWKHGFPDKTVSSARSSSDTAHTAIDSHLIGRSFCRQTKQKIMGNHGYSAHSLEGMHKRRRVEANEDHNHRL